MKTKMKSRMKQVAVAALILFLTALLSSCLPGDGRNNAGKPANFLMGIWHGWVAPLSLIVGIFNGKIRIYELYNSGWWYDLGFYMAIISGFGGITLSRRSKWKPKK